MTTNGYTQRMVSILSAFVMVAAVTTAVSLPATAAAVPADHPTLGSGSVQVSNQPAWPAYFLRDNDTDYQTGYTEQGTLAAVYGHGDGADAAVYASTVPYDQHSNQPAVPGPSRLTAVGDLTGDANHEHQYIAVAGGPGDRTITIFGPQSGSFPIVAQQSLDASVGSVTGLAILGDGTLVVTTTTAFQSWKLSGSTLVQKVSQPSAALLFPIVPGSALDYLDPADVLDIAHLPWWRSSDASTNPAASENRDLIRNSFEVLYWWGEKIYASTVTVLADGGFQVGARRLMSDRNVPEFSGIVAGRIAYTYTHVTPADDYSTKKEVAVELYFADEPGYAEVSVESPGIHTLIGKSECVTTLDTTDPANVPELVGVARPSATSSAFACAHVVTDAIWVTVFDASRGLVADATTVTPGYSQLGAPHIALENTPEYLDDARWALFPPPAPAIPNTPAYEAWLKSFPDDQVRDQVSLSMAFAATSTGGAQATLLASRTYCLQDSCDPAKTGTGLPRQAYPTSTWVTPIGAAAPTGGPQIFVPLPPTANQVVIKPDDPTHPQLVEGNPVPVAVLSAPPTVAGAGQDGSAPRFTSSKGQSSSSGTSESAHVGASVGLGFESPGGMFGASVSASIEREVESTYTVSKDITFSDSYAGSMDDDTLIYQTTPQWVFPGTVVTSSSGIGVGSKAAITIPDADGAVMASGTLTYLKARFPTLFGPGGTYGDGLAHVLHHTVGDPGSYLGYSDQNLDQYCIGSVGGSTADDVSAGPKLDINPFFNNPDPPGKPDILISNSHIVTAGTSTIEGAEFDIDKSQENSRVANTTVDVAVEATAAFITAGVNGGYGWGESYSRSLSEGVGFSAGIGNIPNAALTDEAYSWRMFLCNVNLDTNDGRSLPIRMLNYTVNNYVGSGGLEPLGPVVAVSPTGSAFTDLTPTLTWKQDSGTVKSYDWQVEAIGAQDDRSGAIGYASTVAAQARSTQSSAAITNKLLANQLYRWRVTSTDFFGNTQASSWEYFVTEGPPRAGFTFSPSTPKIGTDVVFTDTSQNGGLPTTQSWTFPDGTIVTGPSAMHPFGESGAFPVTLRVSNGLGEDQVTKIVPVVTGSLDDHYVAVEDTVLDVDAAGGVLANDGAAGTLTATINQPPESGTATLTADGSFTYEPAPDFCGADAFPYTLSGGNNFTDSAVATIDVACVNDPPVAADDTLAATEDAAQHVTAPGLIANITDPDVDDTYTVEAVDQPTHGTLGTIGADGSYSYTPDANYCGPDAFTYLASDGEATSNVATIAITVTCVNDVPLAVDDVYRVDPGAALTVDAVHGVLANDTDVEDGLASVATPDTDASHGTLVLSSDGSFTYTPTDGYSGTDSFTYFPGDDTDTSPVAATVVIRVASANVPPPTGGSAAGDQSGGNPEPGVEVLGVSRQERIGGPDRYQTSALIAQQFGTADAIIVANGEPAKQGADALSANYLAGQIGAPILLTRAADMPGMTLSTIRQVLRGAAHAKIYVMGKTDAVSDAAVDQARVAAEQVSAGPVTVIRIGGDDRYQTSAQIAAERGPVRNSIALSASGPHRATAILACGQVTADALVAGALSYAWGIPVLLTAADRLSPSIAKTMRSQGITQLVILGGTDRISQRVIDQAEAAGVRTVKRISGADRFDTAAQMYGFAMDIMTGHSDAHYGAGSGMTAYLVNGVTGFSDALSAGPLAGAHQDLVLTVPSAALPDATAKLLSAHQAAIDAVVALGQPATIAESIIDEATSML